MKTKVKPKIITLAERKRRAKRFQDNIPEELQNEKRWAVTRMVDGQQVPGTRFSNNDKIYNTRLGLTGKDTKFHMAFGEAIDLYVSLKGAIGLSFIGTGLDLLQIDADNVYYKDEKGHKRMREEYKPYAKVIKEADVYREFSRSGLGIHAYVRLLGSARALIPENIMLRSAVMGEKVTQIEFKYSKKTGKTIADRSKVVFSFTGDVLPKTEGTIAAYRSTDVLTGFKTIATEQYDDAEQELLVELGFELTDSDVSLNNKIYDTIEWSSVSDALSEPLQTVAQALEHMDYDDYHTWIKVGQALQLCPHKHAKLLWGYWSSQSVMWTNDKRDADEKWESFNDVNIDKPYSIYGILKDARENGWNPVEKVIGILDTFKNADSQRSLIDLKNSVVQFMCIMTPEELDTSALKLTTIKRLFNTRLKGLDIDASISVPKLAAELDTHRKAFVTVKKVTYTDKVSGLASSSGDAHSDHMATLISALVSESGHKMVSQGKDVYMPIGNLWCKYDRNYLVRAVMENYDINGSKGATTLNEYKAIAEGAMIACIDNDFFKSKNVTPGFATADGLLWTVTAEGICSREITLDDHIRDTSIVNSVIEPMDNYNADDLWDPKMVAELPLFYKFMRTSLGEGQYKQQLIVLQEFIGLCITDQIVPFQTILILLDKIGGAGKNTFDGLLRGLVGVDNYSSVAINDMAKDTTAIQTYGVKINFAPEHDHLKPFPEREFKMISGEDDIQYKNLYSDSFSGITTCGHKLNLNKLPIHAADGAILRRLRFVEFKKTFTKTIHGLSGKIVEAEGNKLLWFFLKGAQRALANDAITKTSIHYEIMKECGSETNSVTRFCASGDYFNRRGTDKEFLDMRTDLYSIYAYVTEQDGQKVMSTREFKHYAAHVGVTERRSRIGVPEGQTHYKVFGARLTPLGKKVMLADDFKPKTSRKKKVRLRVVKRN